jgi:hypothetical protein
MTQVDRDGRAAMSDGLGVDVYVEMTSPRVRVTVDEGLDNRVEVRIGDVRATGMGETSTVHLWFKRPQAVLELGSELIKKGQVFLEQQSNQAVER